jgi:hypothetical protein
VTAYKKFTDLYPSWIVLGFFLVGLELGVAHIVLRKVP